MKGLTKSICLALISTGLTITSVQAQAAEPTGDMEKCYGVAKAGKNDCGSTKGQAHSCQGNSTKSGDKSDWLAMPKGLCEKIVNGSTTPGNG